VSQISNIFQSESPVIVTDAVVIQPIETGRVPNYAGGHLGFLDYLLFFVKGFVAGFGVFFIFYRLPVLSVAGGVVIGIVNIFFGVQSASEKRRRQLRAQFFDLLESMTVSMRAGHPPLRALVSAREDLSVIYPEDSDIIMEVDLMVGRFDNGVPLSEIFNDFAERSNIEDIASFASIYATIEGKSSRADQIVRETQQIIADKMEIEIEIETLMTAARSEVNIMLLMPLAILAIVGYAGGGFMDAIYTTAAGRIVATGGLVMFIVSYILARIFSKIEM